MRPERSVSREVLGTGMEAGASIIQGRPVKNREGWDRKQTVKSPGLFRVVKGRTYRTLLMELFTFLWRVLDIFETLL